MIKYIYIYSIYIYIYTYIMHIYIYYIYIKPSLSVNAHHDVIDFKFHEIPRNKGACHKGRTWLFNEVKNS